jgi:hypothetical protein
MAFLDDAIGAVKKAAGFGKLTGDTLPELVGGMWTITGANWYQVYGYQFQVDAYGVKYYFTLPIPPQTISISPVIPSKITPTMGGVVEEHSAVTFWQINMAGTTGVGVSRRDGDELNRKYMAGQFREILSTTGLLAGKFNELNKSINKIGGLIDGAINTVTNFTEAKNPLDAISAVSGGVVGTVNNALLPPLPYSSSAVKQESNGFTEAQELQRFFYAYQKLKADAPGNVSLHFVNYKTNQKWRVAVKNFSLQQSANEPMLYKYSISLQGWDCVAPSEEPGLEKAFDRFAPGGDLSSVNTMGLSASGKVGAAVSAAKKALKIKF